MPSPSEQLSQQAYQDARTGVTRTVATSLRGKLIDLVAGGIIPAPPPDPDWDALANEAINNRTIGGTPLSRLPNDSSGRSADSLIPTAQRAEIIARDVSAGVAENTGSMEMLQGATIGQALRGFFSMMSERGIGAAISGVFNLMFGDGNSDDAKALKGFIGGNTASAIGEGVTERLRANQAQNGLTNEQIAQVGIEAQNSARTRAGLPPLPVPGAPAGSAPAASGPETSITDGVRARMRAPVVESLTEEKFGEMAQGMGLTTLDQTQRTAITDSMTNALTSVATQTPPLTDAVSIRNAIQAQLTTNADAMGMSGMPPADRTAMLELMANELTVNYMKNRPPTQAAGEVFERDVVRGRNAELKQQLVRGRIRPAVMQGLGLQENPPGTFVTVSGPNGAQPQIAMLESLKGSAMDNGNRTALVNTLSGALEQVAGTNMTDPTAIRDEIKRRLEGQATQMGLDGLSPDDRNRLFTLMANESTVNYLNSTGRTEAATQFTAPGGAGANTAQLKQELIVGRIRPGVITQMGLQENPPGTFINRDPLPADAPITQLEQAKGSPLDNTQRTAVVNTLSSSLQHVAQQQPPLTIEQTQAYIQQQLTANADAMGFGALSNDEKTHLFRRMANESTLGYITQMNVGTQAERDAFRDTANRQGREAVTALAPGAVRRSLEGMMNPATEGGRDTLGLLTIASGGNSFNRDSLINALTPTIADLATRQPKLNPDNATDLAIASARIEEAIRNANPPTGIPLDGPRNPGEESTLQKISKTIAKKALGGSDRTTGAPGEQLVTAEWDNMMNGFRTSEPQLYQSLSNAIDMNTVRGNISTALTNVIRNNPDFHSKSPEQRRELLKAAIKDSLRNGAVPDGRNVEVGEWYGGMSIAPDRARQALADLMADKLTGINNPPSSYMPVGNTPGATNTGLKRVEDIDTGQISGIVTDISSGNIGSGLNRIGDGLGSIVDYWRR